MYVAHITSLWHNTFFQNWWSDLGTEECDNITLLASIYKLSNKVRETELQQKLNSLW